VSPEQKPNARYSRTFEPRANRAFPPRSNSESDSAGTDLSFRVEVEVRLEQGIKETRESKAHITRFIFHLKFRAVPSPSPLPLQPRRTLAMTHSPLAAIKPPRPFFQSHPSHTELVDSYLRTWVEDGVKTGAFIHDADVYGSDPADLLQQFAPVVAHNGERAWYFYSLLRYKHSSGKRKKRSTGSGTWHSEAKPKPVFMASKSNWHQIGLRQTFSFVVRNETGALFRTGWIMMEHRLLNDDGEEKQQEEEGFLVYRVLCKVYRSPRKPEPSGNKAAAAASPGHKIEADDDESNDATLDENDDDESNDATLDENDDGSNAAPPAASGRKRKSDDVEPSEAKASDVIAGGAAAAPAPKKKSDGSSSPVATSPTTEMQCPGCGHHVLVTMNRAEPKSQTEIAKDESAPGARQQGEIRMYEFL
jgi:hypothetical protein